MPKTRPMAIVTSPGIIEFQDRPLPTLGPDEVQIKVKAVSICGSDLHIFKGAHPAAPLPVPAGHEIAGEVEKVGNSVNKLKPGDRVAIEPVIVCEECYFCQRGEYSLCENISFQYRKGQGGFTPLFIAREKWVHPLPANLSYAEVRWSNRYRLRCMRSRKATWLLGITVLFSVQGQLGCCCLCCLNRLVVEMHLWSTSRIIV